jgi:hypothetical protein
MKLFLLEKTNAEAIHLNQTLNLKFSLGMKCAPEKKNYLYITETRPSLSFYVIAKPKINMGLFAKLNFFLTVRES